MDPIGLYLHIPYCLHKCGYCDFNSHNINEAEMESYVQVLLSEMEHAARDEVLKSGGSLSHHHGIGKIRQDFLPRVFSPGMMDWQLQIKKAADPSNVFGAGNQGFEET